MNLATTPSSIYLQLCVSTMTDCVKEILSTSMCVCVCVFLWIERWCGVYSCVLSKSRLWASSDPSWRVLPCLHGDLSSSGERVSVRLLLLFAL